MLIASIDIGSNTVLMLISEVDLNRKIFSVVKNFYEIPRIGKGILAENSIAEEKIVILISTLSKFKEELVQFNCKEVICIATNAMRIARNQTEIIERVFQTTGIRIDVISGNEEATLSYFGAVSGNECGKYLVIDIGGGSTEIIFGDQKNIEFKKSFQVGVVSFYEKYIKDFPVPDSIISEIEFVIAEQLNDLPKFDFSNYDAISIAGTPTTLAAIKNNLTKFDEEKIEGDNLSIEDIDKQISLFKNFTPQEILSKYSAVVKGREDLILVGAIILKTIMTKLNIKQTTVSTRGIRYGLVQRFINESTSPK